nr:MurR/RpiR family transcriptional regulator [Paracoccus aestuariivivens]
MVARSEARLTDADARLLDILLQDPIRAAMDSGKEIAARAGVHPASAVRLARRLGFQGYPEFRAFLQDKLIDDAGGDFDNPAARISARLVRAEKGGILSSILDSEIGALEQVRHAVSDADVRGFAKALHGAQRIFVYGLGHSAALSALIALRLRRSGYDAVDLAALPHLAEFLTEMTGRDVLWLLSFRDPRPVVSALLRIATDRSATLLLLSDMNGLRIEPAPERSITVSRGGVGHSQSLVVPMTIANAVILDLAAIDEGRSLRSLEKFRSFRAALPPEIPR